jgi:hypothetical protein
MSNVVMARFSFATIQGAAGVRSPPPRLPREPGGEPLPVSEHIPLEEVIPLVILTGRGKPGSSCSRRKTVRERALLGVVRIPVVNRRDATD